MFQITFTSTSEATELANTEINILFALKSFSYPFFLSMYTMFDDIYYYKVFFSRPIFPLVTCPSLHYTIGDKNVTVENY